MPGSTFVERLESKVRQQLESRRVGYLLGAGASYLNGAGYPLAGALWERIKAAIEEPFRSDIQAKLDGGAEGLEQALDLLDDGSATEKTHRHLVTEAIANHFLTLEVPTAAHERFLTRVAQRSEHVVPVFGLNYDGLLERAADNGRVRMLDGFLGFDRPYFEPQIFQERSVSVHRGRKGLQIDIRRGAIHLYKLHGSMGWFQHTDGRVAKHGLHAVTPSEHRRMMVPPQHRKTIDTTALPYSSLWSDFRGLLCQGPLMLNRLVTIGYGMRDEHVNAIIENALARSDFSLLVFAYELTPDVFTRWSTNRKTIVVTSNTCSLHGEVGPGHRDLWDFERISQIL